MKATGKSTGNYDNIMRMIVKDGKLAHTTMYQGPGASLMDAALTPDADKFFVVEHQFLPPPMRTSGGSARCHA